ncbi:MAG: hypothetical protein GHCLOJNM_04425 [bacterium]|nr:hypothetical protein [bacterium]
MFLSFLMREGSMGWVKLILGLLVALALVHVGFRTGLLPNFDSYTPDKGDFELMCPGLYAGGLRVEGVFASSDVTCGIFKASDEVSEATGPLSSRIVEKLVEQKWDLQPEGVYSRAGEVIRIEPIDSSSVLIGVISFSGDRAKSFAYSREQSGELRWADSEFWPVYERTLNQMKSSSFQSFSQTPP